MNAALEAALKYAAAGMFIVPVHGITPDGKCTCGKADCSKPGKVPFGGSKWQDIATTDADTIRKWAWTYPGCNFGLHLDKSRLVVIDVDSDEGHEWARSLEIPPTLIVMTGTKPGQRHRGEHYLFRATTPNPGGPARKSLGPGVELLTGNGHVVIEGSRHVAGFTYEEEHRSTGTVADAPAWLLAARAPSSSQPPAPAEAGNAAQRMVADAVLFVTRDGHGRNETGLWLACQLRDLKLSKADAEPHLLDFQRQVRKLREPHYTRKEAMETLRSAFSKPPRDLPTKPQGAQKVPAQKPSSLNDLFDGEVVTLGELTLRKFVPLRFAVGGLFPLGALTIVCADPKAGKSQLMLEAAAAVANGTQYLGRDTIEGKTLYLDYDANAKPNSSAGRSGWEGAAPIS